MTNLREHFAVVGVKERFDETLVVLARAFGWSDVSYERQNVTENRLAAEDLPESAVEAILDANRFDAALHKLARSLLEEKIIHFHVSNESQSP